MRGKIKIGVVVSQDHGVGRWPSTAGGETVDPKMVFDMTWEGSYWNCIAPGYGVHAPGKYGNGSIFVHGKEGVILVD